MKPRSLMPIGTVHPWVYKKRHIPRQESYTPARNWVQSEYDGAPATATLSLPRGFN